MSKLEKWLEYAPTNDLVRLLNFLDKRISVNYGSVRLRQFRDLLKKKNGLTVLRSMSSSDLDYVDREIRYICKAEFLVEAGQGGQMDSWYNSTSKGFDNVVRDTEMKVYVDMKRVPCRLTFGKLAREYDSMTYKLGAKMPLRSEITSERVNNGKMYYPYDPSKHREIDCSGFVAQCMRYHFESCGISADRAKQYGPMVPTKSNFWMDNAAGIVRRAANMGCPIQKFDPIANNRIPPVHEYRPKDGDIIGEDWKKPGIDHIVACFEGSDGVLYICESGSSVRGVHTRTAEAWQRSRKNCKLTIFNIHDLVEKLR